ncbi:hypothetical protein L227DRAFT_587060 [Lentinus tigrinus ALCF2SS1-6]|uniref:Zn(2)-C6 fungal-type domain-containing protein n=1 Tax=Lentinus tigrinus ALCF2SS1-6 TaxID=1328759 RepID=A0A5C2S4R2_9APHY|nr:hypothetical protein L227DRAFT_587060 [Lentinus tigrinus ALCF2SS1-6]
MVASSNGDLYTPFPHMIEEGIQSSEEGSDLHSPVFEASYATPDARYHLGHFDYDVSGQLLPPPSTFDARYPVPAVVPHSRDPHILETLQPPSPPTMQYHPQPPHSPADLSLHGHPMLELGRLHPGAMNPIAEYSMHLSQPPRIPEQQVRMSADPMQSLPSRQPTTILSAEQKPQIALPSSSGPVRSNPSGSNSSSTRPPRREASTVVIACRQCRARKIRCDSTRPNCHNCLRRNNDCEYDAVPKRRGPDKRPGTRQRSCKKRPPDAEPASAQAKKKRKTSAEGESGVLSFDVKVKENVTGGARRGQLSSRSAMDDMNAIHIPPPPGQLYIDTSIPSRGTGPDSIYPKDELSPSFRRPSVMDPNDPKSFARPIDVNVSRQHEEPHKLAYIPLSPPISPLGHNSLYWWDDLLDLYSSTSREQAMNDIFADLHSLFTTTSYWLSFINVELFFRDLRDPSSRARMQSLVMSALAMAMLMKSSEIELGSSGREIALTLRDRARACLEHACNTRAPDYQMAGAALILALFETSCHPLYSPDQASSALQLLDRIIRALSLYSMDRDDPFASRFDARSVPVVYMPDGYRRPVRCSCMVYPPTPGSPTFPDHLSYSSSYAPWDPNWLDVDIRKEECRRLCWCALTLVSAYTAHCSAFHTEPVELNLTEPSNYALLFPGEACDRMGGPQQASGQSPKESVWALYCRSMLLWNSCSCIQRDESLTTDERAKLAISAFQEAQQIQDALEMHVCNHDTGLKYVCREYLYNTRMTITYELRRRLQDGDIPAPMFNRRQAEEWLTYQAQVAHRVKESVLQLGETQGHLLSRRPFQVTWFSSQVAICLGLWEFDHRLINALELAKTFLIPLDVLNALWPCPEQRMRRDELRQRLEAVCLAAGLPAPLPKELTLPPILQRTLNSGI